MDSEEEGRDSGEAVMDLVEVEMDSGEAAMVQLAPEVAAKVLPEVEEMVVAVKVAAVMAKPGSEVEVVMVQTEETTTEEEGVEEEIRAPREAAASLAQLELAEEGIQEEEEEEEIRAPREAMVQSLRLVLVGEEIQEEEEEEEEEALRNLPEIRRAVPAVEITVVAQGVEDLAAAASVKREKEEATPQEQLPRALPVRAVVEVVDSREAMVQSLRLVLAVKLVVAVAEKEEEVAAAATLRQF